MIAETYTSGFVCSDDVSDEERANSDGSNSLRYRT